MYDALFDEVLAMRDAWGWDADEALRFIGENLDMYPELVEAYVTFTEVMTEVYGDAINDEKGLTLH